MKRWRIAGFSFLFILWIFIGAIRREKIPLPWGEQTGLPSSITPIGSTTAPEIQPSVTESPTTTESPMGPAVQQGTGESPNRDDVLLLYDSTRHSPFDINFCSIATYYGLGCRKLAINTQPLTPASFLDDAGKPFALIGISALSVIQNPAILGANGVRLLQSAAATLGEQLLVAEITSAAANFIFTLTQGAVQNVYAPADSTRDWTATSTAPEITREFTGQTIRSTGTPPPRDYALTTISTDSVSTLITGSDDQGKAYPVFVRWKTGLGSMLLDAGERESELNTYLFQALYYNPYYFSQILPMMMAFRSAAPTESWHVPQDYANLTIDDAALQAIYEKLNYGALLREMLAHPFHTTIAFPPVLWSSTEIEVAALFLSHPGQFSLVQKGNNNVGYEFYQYTVAPDQLYNGISLPARPLLDQQWDILEGLSRLGMMQNRTGIPFDRVMVFPQGISPAQTLVLLKQYNYLATVNTQDIPLGAYPPADRNFGMYPASVAFADFPALVRRAPGAYQPFRPNLQPFLFDLFLGKPALFFSTAGNGALFDLGIDAFDPVADSINALPVPVTWASLGTIAHSLYWEKANDDGSMEIRLFANDTFLKNESAAALTFHVRKSESGNVPIAAVTINGHPFPYKISNEILALDAVVPGGAIVEIQIEYEP